MNIHTVHLIFTAALAHVQDAYLSPEESVRNTARKDLQTCFEALSEIGNAYKNALRALEVITCIKADLLRNRQNLLKRSPVGVEPVEAAPWLGKRARVGGDRSVRSDIQGDLYQRSPLSDELDPDGFDTLDSGIDIYAPASLMDETLFTEPWTWTPAPSSIHPSLV